MSYFDESGLLSNPLRIRSISKDASCVRLSEDNEVLFRKMPHSSSPALPALTRRPIAETGGIPRQKLYFPSVTVSEQQGIDINIAHAAWPLRVYENLRFPSWCPCQTKKYTTPPQAPEERLFISKSVLERFIELEYFQIMWIYQELFKFLYWRGIKKKISGIARTLTYSQLAPLWIRRQIAIQPDDPDDINGDGVAEVVTLKKVAITHLRNERNTQGYRRVRFLLTAFFCHEPETLKPLIQHLFRTVPSIRAVTKRKVSKKRNHPNEHSQPQGNAQSNKRLESESEQARMTSSTNRQDGSSSTTANGRRSQRPQSSTETHEIQQNPHPPNAVLSQITADIRTNVRTPLHSNVRAPSQSTTNAISANNEASNPTPTRSLGLIANVSSSQENKTTQLLKRKSVFDGTPSNSTRIQENMQPGPYPSNQISREETGAFAHIAETTREQQENAENQSTPPEKHLLQPGLSPTLQEEEERIIEQLKDLGEDKEDLTDPRNGVVKCGSLARCVYILNHFMQSEKEVDGNCKRCNYKMHKRCVALHNVCDKCVKHTVFKSIYDADI